MSTAKGQAEKDKGNAAFKTGDYATAVGHYSAAIVADPTNTTYPLNRAAACLKLGKNEDAERDCSTVLRLDARNVKALFRRGQARAALQRLGDAQEDFRKALQLGPANDAAKQELAKAEEALKKQTKPPRTTAADVPVLSSSASASTSEPKPKRRRVPIEIVDGPPPASTPPTKDDLMTPVSSRQLSSSAVAGPSSATTTPPAASATPSPPPRPKTFQEAKDARARAPGVGGGIFRPSGQHTIVGARSDSVPSPAPSPGSKPKPAATLNESTSTRPPMTLFAFTKRWEKEREGRWQLLNEIPPPALPALFQSSLDASLLGSMLHTFRDVLTAGGADGDAVRAQVCAYLTSLARVPRFGTVLLFMSAEERKLAREVWQLVGASGAQSKVERQAWGLDS